MRRVIILPHFVKELKPLVKKHPSLKDAVIKTLETCTSTSGIRLDNDLYKLRLTAPELKRGKSKAFRLIVLLLVHDDMVVPVTIYFKGTTENLTTRDLNHHLEAILWELSDGTNR